MQRLACLTPVVVIFFACWLLPMAWLVALPAQKGWETYFAIFTHPRYWLSLVNTVGLSLLVTVLTLVLGSAVGIFLARHQFIGRGI